jgi:hypothetical protein
MERVTAQQAAGSHQQTFKGPINFYGFMGIVGTGRVESAVPAQKRR